MAPSSGSPTDLRRSECHSGSHQPKKLRLGAVGTLLDCLGLRQLAQDVERVAAVEGHVGVDEVRVERGRTH